MFLVIFALLPGAHLSSLTRLVNPEASSAGSPLSILNAGLWGFSESARPWYVAGNPDFRPSNSRENPENGIPTSNNLHLPTTPLYNRRNDRRNEYKSPRDGHYRQLIKTRKGQDGHMTHLMRVFGFLPPGQRNHLGIPKSGERSTPKTFIPEPPPGGAIRREGKRRVDLLKLSP